MTKKRFRLTNAEKARLDSLTFDPISKSMAVLMSEENFSAHRGAAEIDDGPDIEYQCIVFGNDGFESDVRSRKQVARLAMKLDELEIPLLGFGVEPDGYTWALRVDFEDAELLDLVVWDVWFDLTCPDANPVKEELSEYLDAAGLAAA
ncbi:hypothetical protein LOC67_20295 [Stieleria sp. JC731]|uniref:hypothetical protein n=1 Tax=Pirellulaceae TaxID=2691357 RepID=UPI001E5C814D|nr:hypothetical protein [Stieleria sp. JC731]MCC9602897.1 hypothetical protein [Stieleria sp. JC731]